MLNSDTQPSCHYDSPGGFALIMLTFVSHAVGLLWKHNKWSNADMVSWFVDAVCLFPGVFFLMTTKPDGGWYGAVPQPLCSMRESGYAMSLWLLGELLTFGTGLRLSLVAEFGKNILNTTLIVLGFFAFQFGVGVLAEDLTD